MKLVFLPEPKRISAGRGSFAVPRQATIAVADPVFLPVAKQALDLFHDASIRVALPRVADTVVFKKQPGVKEGGYRLVVDPAGVRLEAAGVAGACAGLQTLNQALLQAERDAIPAFRIDDWPDFRERGVYYDVCRGRVPSRESLLRMVDRLAAFKINHLQLYIEHTFAFRAHPAIGRNCSPLTADDILALDDACAERNIELVPSLASFGHLAPVLSLPQYRHMAEDWGVGRYVDPEADAKRKWLRTKAFTLSPANPEIYEFLDSLFREFLPLFRSRRFNVCCDETLDLGLGQSYELCRRIGKGRLYLNHVLKLRKIVARYGKRIMFWGDIIRHYPELIPAIPRDVTVLDWGYSYGHLFDTIGDFKKPGVPFFACPGTSSWVSLFPRLPNAEANIAGFAAAGRKHGAVGLLNTDWGDGGHYNFMEYSWYGYLFGAEQAWNTGADRSTFAARFCRLFLGSDDVSLVRAVKTLGEVAQVHRRGYYEQYWRHVFFSGQEGWAGLTGRHTAEVLKGQRIEVRDVTFDARFGRANLEKLDAVRAAIAAHAARRDEDPHGVLPYWLFAVDTLRCAARRLALMGPGGPGRASDRLAIAREMTALRGRFERLWLSRNQRSEIRTTLKAYDNAIRGLRRGR